MKCLVTKTVLYSIFFLLREAGNRQIKNRLVGKAVVMRVTGNGSQRKIIDKYCKQIILKGGNICFYIPLFIITIAS